MKQIRKHITYANVMSSIAVFLVLGGAAFAATVLPKNSVGTKQLVNNAVTTAKIKKEAVTGAKIKAGTITGDKIKAGAITGTSINLSTLGTVPSATKASHADSASNADDASKLGGQLPSAYQSRVQWATVKSDGTILAQSGGISLQDTGGGGYYVNFGNSVVGKGIVTSLRYLDPDRTGFVVDQICSGPTTTFPCIGGTGNLNNPNVVFVNTLEIEGNNEPEGFNILVTP